jgi:ectoine hydroxylase-related dioxygenase (phytanoyl-CoA dioxygenase family)
MQIKSYTDLEFFFRNSSLFENLTTNIQNEIFDKKLQNSFFVMIGLYLLGIDFKDGFYKFNANRYFLNSIGIDIYPDEKEFFDFTKYFDKLLHTNNILKKEWFNNLDDRVNNLSKSNHVDIFKNYQIKGLSKNQLSHFDEKGYLIVENCLTDKLCDELLSILNNLAESENLNDTSYKYGSGKLQRIYHLINKNKIFQNIILHNNIHDLNDHAFDRETLHDKYYLSSLHANILSPGAEEQIIHVDAAVPSPLPEWIIRTNVNFIIHDYTYENGATLCYPGSHKFLRIPDRTQNYKNKLIPLEAKKGSLVFWNGHLWHKSGANNSNKNRYSILGCFAASFLREMVMEENPYISSNITVNEKFSPELKSLLGWNHGQK